MKIETIIKVYNYARLFIVLSLVFLLCLWAYRAEAQESVTYKPAIHGTIRGKYELQEGEQRFEVRTARISVDGSVSKRVSYKAEIDLCDEGAIKMLDAYGKVNLLNKGRNTIDVQIGQYRVPFTIDAHRSPHQQYFANRSFIAKQVGSVRDVGISATYTVSRNDAGWGNILQGGFFNGSGLTGLKDFWTKEINFSIKEQLLMPNGFLLEASMQKVKPNDVTVKMYDGALQWHNNSWMCEAEYVHKNYAHNAFDGVNAVDAFVCYDQKLSKKEESLLKKLSYLARYDYMGDNSDGIKLTDAARQRITAGFTLSFAQKAFVANLRLNYEKYFYGSDATIKTSEHDKVVAELMVRF